MNLYSLSCVIMFANYFVPPADRLEQELWSWTWDPNLPCTFVACHATCVINRMIFQMLVVVSVSCTGLLPYQLVVEAHIQLALPRMLTFWRYISALVLWSVPLRRTYSPVRCSSCCQAYSGASCLPPNFWMGGSEHGICWGVQSSIVMSVLQSANQVTPV